MKGIAGLQVRNIGIGSISTFHGMPDLRLDGLSYIIATNESTTNFDNEDTEQHPSGYSSEGKAYEHCVLVFSFLAYF